MLRFLWANRAPIVISGALGLASDVTCQWLTQDMVVEIERLEMKYIAKTLLHHLK